jgi:hypothetical protein
MWQLLVSINLGLILLQLISSRMPSKSFELQNNFNRSFISEKKVYCRAWALWTDCDTQLLIALIISSEGGRNSS